MLFRPAAYQPWVHPNQTRALLVATCYTSAWDYKTAAIRFSALLYFRRHSTHSSTSFVSIANIAALPIPSMVTSPAPLPNANTPPQGHLPPPPLLCLPHKRSHTVLFMLELFEKRGLSEEWFACWSCSIARLTSTSPFNSCERGCPCSLSPLVGRPAHLILAIATALFQLTAKAVKSRTCRVLPFFLGARDVKVKRGERFHGKL